jgi:hypothetical protein
MSVQKIGWLPVPTAKAGALYVQVIQENDAQNVMERED